MKTKHKALLLSVCAILLVVASVFGTLAYLTDKETVTNTFTVGKVGLKLDEAKVNQMGESDGETRWQPTDSDEAQEYHLLPGHTYVKDPTVTVDAGSEKAYIRMMVTVTFKEALNDAQLATSLDEIFTGHDSEKWIRADKAVSADKKTITYEYRYYTTVDGKDDKGNDAAQKLEPLFKEIKVPGEYTNEQIAALNEMVISVEAHAIQVDSFADADAAWDAFDKQYNPPAQG